MMIQWLAPALLALLVAGCSDPNWRTTDISEIMPPLDFSLVSENGEAVTEEAFQGKTTLVYFGYTHCPDVCPTSMAKMAAAIKQLDESAREDVQVLFVSVDPERDTPPVLARYTEVFGPQFVGLTGDTPQLDAVTNRYRISYGYGDEDENGNYDVSHSSAIFAFDAQGDARLLMRDSDPLASIVGDLKRLIARG